MEKKYNLPGKFLREIQAQCRLNFSFCHERSMIMCFHLAILGKYQARVMEYIHIYLYIERDICFFFQASYLNYT